MSNQLPPPNLETLKYGIEPPHGLAEAVVGNTIEIEKTREALIPEERLKEMAMQSAFGLHAYIDRSKSPEDSAYLDVMSVHGFNSLTTDKGVKRIIGEVGGRFKGLSKEKLEELLKQKATELVIVAFTDTSLDTILGRQATTTTQQEGAVIIQYVVLAGENPDGLEDMSVEARKIYEAYGKKATAPHPQLEASVLMPRSLGEEFILAAQEDPQLFRELIESEVKAKVGDENMWDGPRGIRPNYEGWHEFNDGVDRIALVEKQSGKPQERKILEFSAVN